MIRIAILVDGAFYLRRANYLWGDKNPKDRAREPNLETLEAIADYFNVDMNTLTDSKTSAELNSELQEYLEELKNRSEMRMLFSLAKGATKEDVEKAVRIIEALQKDE